MNCVRCLLVVRPARARPRACLRAREGAERPEPAGVRASPPRGPRDRGGRAAAAAHVASGRAKAWGTRCALRCGCGRAAGRCARSAAGWGWVSGARPACGAMAAGRGRAGRGERPVRRRTHACTRADCGALALPCPATLARPLAGCGGDRAPEAAREGAPLGSGDGPEQRRGGDLHRGRAAARFVLPRRRGLHQKGARALRRGARQGLRGAKGRRCPWRSHAMPCHTCALCADGTRGLPSRKWTRSVWTRPHRARPTAPTACGTPSQGAASPRPSATRRAPSFTYRWVPRTASSSSPRTRPSTHNKEAT